MRIAEIPHTFLPHIGGLENYVYRLSRDLSNKGNDVQVLTSDMGIGNSTSISKFNFKVIYFKAFPIIFGNPFTIQLLFHLIRNDYDIIHAHSIQAFPTQLAALFKKKSKFIITSHGVAPDSPNFLLKLIWTCYIPIARYICNKSDKIIVLGEAEKEKITNMLHIDSTKIVVIPNGIDMPKCPSAEIIDNFKFKYNLQNNNIILFTGRVLPTKNPEIVLESFSKLNMPNVKLLFVGPIDLNYEKFLTRKLNKNIYKNIIFTGKVSEQDLFAAYSLSDIFISLGGWEGLPTTMLESMYFGKPCIMYQSGAISDVIIDEKNGILINDLDSDIISKKIRLLLNDKKIYKKISENAKETITNNYRWELCMEKIYKLYMN